MWETNFFQSLCIKKVYIYVRKEAWNASLRSSLSRKKKPFAITNFRSLMPEHQDSKIRYCPHIVLFAKFEFTAWESAIENNSAISAYTYIRTSRRVERVAQQEMPAGKHTCPFPALDSFLCYIILYPISQFMRAHCDSARFSQISRGTNFLRSIRPVFN